MPDSKPNYDDLMNSISKMFKDLNIPQESFKSVLVQEMVLTALRLYYDEHPVHQLKLMNHTLKEMRYAYKVFNEYPEGQRFSVFGSARTPEDHPDYHAAMELSRQLTVHDWRCITGAAHGIMKAGHEGSEQENIFGLSIKLAFESSSNEMIEGDPKLIHFRYFFTRKLMFLSHSDAVVVFPGGVGTMDELFETLTLIQTGKAAMIPVVLVQGAERGYWEEWLHFVEKALLANHMISPKDLDLFHIAPSAEAAAEFILNYYKRYHSSRFVKDQFVIRLKSPLTESQVAELNEEFSCLLSSGKIVQGEAFEEEKKWMELPRLIFHFNRRDYGGLQQLIYKINTF